MRRTLVTLAVVAAAAVLPVQAHATRPSIYGTTCGLVAVHEPTGLLMQPDEYQGVIVGPILGVDLAELDDNLVSVTVHCRLVINGFLRESASAVFAPAAVALNIDVAFILTEADTAVLCTDIVATDTSFETRSRTTCEPVTRVDVPPDEVCDVIANVFDVCAIEVQPGDSVLPIEVLVVVPDPVLGA